MTGMIFTSQYSSALPSTPSSPPSVPTSVIVAALSSLQFAIFKCMQKYVGVIRPRLLVTCRTLTPIVTGAVRKHITIRGEINITNWLIHLLEISSPRAIPLVLVPKEEIAIASSSCKHTALLVESNRIDGIYGTGRLVSVAEEFVI